MCKNKNIFCPLFNIIASLITAIGIAGAFFLGLIVSVPALVVITLILGITGIIAIVTILVCNKKYRCECLEDGCLVGSTVGAIITSVLALTLLALPTFTIGTALLIGSVAFFLVSQIISLVNLLVCRFCNDKCDKYNC